MTVPAWKELCRRCNELYAVPDSWWRTVLADPEVIVRVDREAVSLRLRGNLLLRVELRGRGLHCRVPSEYLLRHHPGSLSVLCEEASPAPPCVSSLNELGADYALVRRRACQVTDRRRAVQDRLFLRHGVFLAVDAPLPPTCWPCTPEDLVWCFFCGGMRMPICVWPDRAEWRIVLHGGASGCKAARQKRM
ncbi:MAG: hypothetical protein Q4B25_06620 [Pseudomonadota bacterium]|nr:hypothetical protein [Pseudomonadota bacterium]